MSRLAKYERLVRRLRQRIFDYHDAGQGEKADRILRRAITIKSRLYPPPPTDKWGATSQDRRVLAAHGICWMD